MNKRQQLTAVLALLLPCIAGCGADVEDVEEKPELYERRRPACAKWCEVLLDPVCGLTETSLEDADECEEVCMSDRYTFWDLQDDGTDACFDEVVDFYDCVPELTCEEQSIATRSPAETYMTQCASQFEAVLDCE